MAEKLTSASPRVGIVIQARVGSARLPNKALLPLPLGSSVTLYERVLQRAKQALTTHQVVVAVPDTHADEALVALAKRHGIGTLCGSEHDVLSRFHGAAEQFGLDVVVRLTADNPAVDATFIDEAITAHLKAAADYTITTGLPLGMNIEVIGRAALDTAYRQATAPADREHVTPYLRQRPAEFRLQTLPVAQDYPEAAALRLTVDYPSDYALLSALYSALGPSFMLSETLAFFRQYPWLATLNAANEQVRL